MTELTSQGLVEIALTNPLNAELVRRLARLRLPESMLTAGCLFQALWNHRSGLATDWGVKDYDVIYFDPDLSWEAEDDVIGEVRELCADLDANIEVRNQARVHLWYRQKFGKDYPQLRSARDGIDRYLVAGTCVGLELDDCELYATHGLADLEQGLLRINPLNPQPDLFLSKALSYRARWPWLQVLEPVVDR